MATTTRLAALRSTLARARPARGRVAARLVAAARARRSLVLFVAGWAALAAAGFSFPELYWGLDLGPVIGWTVISVAFWAMDMALDQRDAEDGGG